MNSPRLHGTLLALACACASSSCITMGEGQPATPQRPTVSSDTSTAAPNTLELEAGANWDPDDSFTLPATLRYGYDEATELFVGFVPFQEIELVGPNQQGVGDVALGVRHRLLDESSAPSFAVQATIKLPTADEEKGLGSGEFDAALAAIATKSFDSAALTAYYSLDSLGQPTGGSDVGHTFTLAGGLSLAPGIGGFAELALISIPEQDLELGFITFGTTYSPDSAHVFDVGLLVGLDNDAPELQAIVGLTQNFGSISAARPVSARSNR